MHDGDDDNNNNNNKQTLSKYLTMCPALVLSLECVFVCMCVCESSHQPCEISILIFPILYLSEIELDQSNKASKFPNWDLIQVEPCYIGAKSYLTLLLDRDCSLLASSVRGISQARILEWVAISFCRGSSQARDATQHLHWQADSLLPSLQGSPNRIL